MSDIRTYSPTTAMEQAQQDALGLMHLPPEYLELAVDLQQINNEPYLGSFSVGEPGDEKLVHAYRSHCGPEFNPKGDRLIAKGGLREVLTYSSELDGEFLRELAGKEFITHLDPDLASQQNGVNRLARVMLHKLAGLEYEDEFEGGKGKMVVVTNQAVPDDGARREVRPMPLTAKEKQEAMRKYYQLMEERGYADALVDVPAGDIGIGADELDEYVREHRKRHPKDPYANAVITGTSPEFGGFPSKASTTGEGLYEVHRSFNERNGGLYRTVAGQGFGAVLAHYALAGAGDSGIRFVAFSDRDGMITTEDPAGFEITPEIAAKVMAEPVRKIGVFARLIEKHQNGLDFEIGGSDGIYDVESDVFVPAAFGGGIDAVNADRLRRSGTKIVFEGANEPTTLDGDAALKASEIAVVPDVVANAQGVNGSVITHKAVIGRADSKKAESDEPGVSDDDMMAAIRLSSEKLTNSLLDVAENINTNNLRVAAAARSTARLIVAHGNGDVPDSVRELASV